MLPWTTIARSFAEAAMAISKTNRIRRFVLMVTVLIGKTIGVKPIVPMAAVRPYNSH
jgi:hypothetical protein